MARYNDQTVYGDGTLWGSTSAADNNLLWGIEVDWDGDEAWTGYNEADRCVNLRVRRGRNYLIRADGNGFQPQAVGEATITLTNDDGKYDPFNATGFYYPNIRPGRYAKVFVWDEIGGTKYDIFAGRITEIRPYRRGESRFVDLTVQDGWGWLQDYDAFVVLTEDVTVGEAVDTILDEVAYPDIWGRSVDSGGDSIAYWWEDKRPAETALHDLIYNYEMGRGIVAADGTFEFVRRSYSDTDVVEFTQDVLLKDIGSPQPWETVRNVARVVVNPRVESTGVEIWSMGGRPLVKAGGTLEVFADFRYENRAVPAKNLITPVASTDYEAVSADSNGEETTDDAIADLSVEIDYNFGLSAKLIWTNTGSTDLIITTARLRGDAIDCPYQTTMEQDESGSEQPRSLKLDTQHMQDINQGEGAVLHLARWLSPVQMFPVIAVEQRPEYQFAPDLQDKVALDVDVLSLDDSYRIGAIEHEWLSATGQAVRTTFRLEPRPNMTGLWRFEAQFTTDADTGYYPTVFGY